MNAAVTEGDPAQHVGAGRLGAMLAALAAGAVGYGLAEAITRARTSDSFLVPPGASQLLGYAVGLAFLVGVMLAFELGAPPLLARGGRAARNLRALFRRRLRHSRTRADIDNAEVGLTISVCAIALVAALNVMALKVLLVVSLSVAILMTLKALSSLCRLVGYELGWSALVGFVYGLAGGYLLT